MSCYNQSVICVHTWQKFVLQPETTAAAAAAAAAAEVLAAALQCNVTSLSGSFKNYFLSTRVICRAASSTTAWQVWRFSFKATEFYLKVNAHLCVEGGIIDQFFQFLKSSNHIHTHTHTHTHI